MQNFTSHVNGQAYNNMNAADLSVGDKLVRIITPRYGSVDSVRLVELTVKKVLKSRLVVETAKGVEYRLLLDTSKYSFRTGEVKNRLEGQSEWNRESFDIATAGDPIIEAIVAAHEATAGKKRIRVAAGRAVAAIAQTRYPELAKVEAAIEALQALATQMKEDGDDA